MKVALYIEDGLEQIVLTPENDTEKMVLQKMQDASRTVEIKHGSFYNCQGGWARYSPAYRDESLGGLRDRKSDESTMIVLREKASAEGAL